MSHQSKTSETIQRSRSDVPEILVIRSSARTLTLVLDSIRQEFPNARISVLASEGARDVLLSDPNIQNVISFKETGRLHWRNLSQETREQLKRHAFDLAVSLYNLEGGQGYSNIDWIAYRSGAKQVRGYSPLGTFETLPPGSLVQKSLSESMKGGWVVLNGIVTLFLISGILVGMCIEALLRKPRPPRLVKTQDIAKNPKEVSI